MVKGVVRQIDQLGRIVIPREILRSLNIDLGEPVDIYLKDGVICIEKCKLQCAICGSSEESELLVIDGIHICKECGSKINTALEGKE